MKVFALNVSNTFGISKKKDPNGKEYNMAAMQVLVPFENASGNTKDGGHYTRRGYGVQVAEMPLQPDCLEYFKDVPFPAHIEVATDSEVIFGRMTTVITGLLVKDVKNIKAAA